MRSSAVLQQLADSLAALDPAPPASAAPRAVASGRPSPDAEGAPGAEGVTVANVVERLGERAFALLIVLLGLPNCLPMVPPIPALSGLVLAFVALQLVVGRVVPWLPLRLRRRVLPPDTVARAARRAVPILALVERLARPRFERTLRLGLPAIGCLLVVLSLGLLVAPPIVGQIPIGGAVVLVGVGLVEKDGALVGLGLAVGLTAIGATAGAVYALLEAVGLL